MKNDFGVYHVYVFLSQRMITLSVQKSVVMSGFAPSNVKFNSIFGFHK